MYISNKFKEGVERGSHIFPDGISVVSFAGVLWELIDEHSGEVLVSTKYFRCLHKRLAELNYSTNNKVSFCKASRSRMRG